MPEWQAAIDFLSHFSAQSGGRKKLLPPGCNNSLQRLLYLDVCAAGISPAIELISIVTAE
jgi:hypothetical protein